MKNQKNRMLIFKLLIVGFLGRTVLFGQSSPVRWTAREVEHAPEPASVVELFRPVDIALDDEGLFVLDMDDHNVKIFSRTGSFLYSFGQKGQGPGDFHRPSGLDIQDRHVFVADAGNRRIQVLDKKGNYLSGFKVHFSPYRVLALERDRIVILGLPSGLVGSEKLLHCFNSRGELLWEAVDSFFSGDSVYDLMRNRMFIRKTSGGELWLVPGTDDRVVRRMNSSGFLLGDVKVDENYPLREIAIDARGGRKRILRPFCWFCAVDKEMLYLLIPEWTEDGDLGPGRTVAVLDRSGVHALIDLPVKVSRFAVEGKMIFGLDLDSRLRWFRLGSER